MAKTDETEIYVVNEKNEKIAAKALFTFEANGDNFILYQIDEQAYAGKMDLAGNLKQVEADEWKLVEKVFNQYLEDQDDN